MLEHFKLFHGIWSIVVTFFFLVTLVLTLYHFIAKKEVNSIFRRVSFYVTLTLHVQMIVGVIMLFMNSSLLSGYKIHGFLSSIEHLVSMLTVVLLVTIFNAKIKKTDNVTGFMLGIILIAVVMFGRTFWLIKDISIFQ